IYGFRDHLKPMPLTGLRALLQGSSRYSTRMASAGSIEQTFVSLEDGVRRLTLPLPTGPKHVHCYLVDGTLFDTGLGLGEAPWASVDVERIAITHFHPDHVGGAADAARVIGAPVYQGALDYAQCERVWGSDDWPERMAAWFISHGVPAPVADDLIVQGHAFAAFVRYAIDPELLYEGGYLEDWGVIELPGHADGHLGFLRAGELIEHHRRRLEATEAALWGEGRTAYEVSLALFGQELSPTQRRFAVAETLSHLERLVREGRAARGGDSPVVSYTGT